MQIVSVLEFKMMRNLVFRKEIFDCVPALFFTISQTQWSALKELTVLYMPLSPLNS